MAQAGFGMGLVGFFIFFLAVLIFAPIVRSMVYQVSGFEDMSCKQGLKPCPEGYFCEQSTCVPISPQYSMSQVKPGGY
jgi:hypothetical protein